MVMKNNIIIFYITIIAFQRLFVMSFGPDYVLRILILEDNTLFTCLYFNTSMYM